jgi:hypothetical protein
VNAGEVRKPADKGPATNVATDNGDCKIHNGPNPPPIEGVKLERQSMTGTRMGGRISQIDVTAELGTMDRMVKENNRSDYSRTRSESGKIDIVLRLSLKARNGSPEVANPLVLVQYFGTDAAARGIVKPKQMESVPVRLPMIAGNSVTIDFPHISVEKSESRYRSDWSRTYTEKSGMDYRGFMVTVFDKDHQVIHQTVSHISLVESGDSAIAESKLAEKNYPVNVARRAYEQARDTYFASKEGDADRVLLEQRYNAARDQYYAIRARMEK